MGLLNDITTLVATTPATVYIGYAPTGAALPYIVHRPLIVDSENTAINGDLFSWDYQTTLYCCAGSVEASHNLAIQVLNAMKSRRIGNTVMGLTMGYAGARVEGHFESQITVQLHQGVIA